MNNTRSLFFCQNADNFIEAHLEQMHGAPNVRFTIEGRSRIFLIYTGSSFSLVQLRFCIYQTSQANIMPYGVTCAELQVKGKYTVNFDLLGGIEPCFLRLLAFNGRRCHKPKRFFADSRRQIRSRRGNVLVTKETRCEQRLSPEETDRVKCCD
jgi:hypothetical protein